jgi:dynein light chain LC8-type
MADDDDEEKRVSTRQIKILELRLTEKMALHAADTLDRAMDKLTVEKDLAQETKLKFDKTYGGTWHCVVGRNFACSVTHETKFLVFFKVDHLNCLLFCSDLPTGPPTDYSKKKKADQSDD